MVWLKGCPKCKGDLYLDQDTYGKFQSCLQCGYIRDLIDPATAVAEQSLPTQGVALQNLMAGLSKAS